MFGAETLKKEEVWVSDLTYICVGYGFNYLSLITDAYSKKIVGYCLYPFLSTEGCLNALRMAIGSRTQRENKLIHPGGAPHSDRGVQYCSFEYVQQLREDNILISMTEDREAYDNQIAERVNGILKTEFKLNRVFKTPAEALLVVEASIQNYNMLRPHMSCGYSTPSEAHELEEPLVKHWKPKTKKHFVAKQNDPVSGF